MYKIKNWRENTQGGKKRGWFSLIVGDFKIDNFSLVKGPEGDFIGFPDRSYEKDGETKWTPTVWIEDKKRRYAFQDWAKAELDKIIGVEPDPERGTVDDDIPF
ncbi:unnamed protein product [marine sediment metagenome]|uniref:Uncharacterized protein n=1 Tax=marine sediment metagenome TaxID=412755 RepID=X0TVU2_9ZZZZ